MKVSYSEQHSPVAFFYSDDIYDIYLYIYNIYEIWPISLNRSGSV